MESDNQDPNNRDYTFKRNSDEPTETLLHGKGHPTRKCGTLKIQ